MNRCDATRCDQQRNSNSKRKEKKSRQARLSHPLPIRPTDRHDRPLSLVLFPEKKKNKDRKKGRRSGGPTICIFFFSIFHAPTSINPLSHSHSRSHSRPPPCSPFATADRWIGAQEEVEELAAEWRKEHTTEGTLRGSWRRVLEREKLDDKQKYRGT